MTKKRIGVSYTATNFHYYLDWFTKEDLENDIEIVELSFVRDNTADMYGCAGFILTGGTDIEPAFYNGNKIYINRPDAHQVERDLFEEKIFRYSQLQKLPVLAICRGMQLVNVLQGGDLIQDLDFLNEAHRKEMETDKQHAVKVDPESLLFHITQSSHGQVNSAHHQAIPIHRIGENLKTNAFADDGTIEGIEFDDKSNKGFLLCIQWHPERILNREENPFSKNIKKRFLKEIRSLSMQRIQIINPATEEIIREVREDNQVSISEKLALLQKGQKEWASLSVEDRIACIAKFYDLLDKEKENLAYTLTSETGKPLIQSYNELLGARNRIKFFIDNSAKMLADEYITGEGPTREKISYEPLGVIANISAWNYPYLVGVNVFIPALIGGNAVFYKPSEYAMLTGIHIQQLLYRSGVPENCFLTALGKGSVGELLLSQPLDGYFFTGSYKTGKYIAEKVAPKLVPCQLELGGKDPLYVMEDIEDIEKTAAAVLEGVVYNNGQSCCAVERIYVHEKIYDRFVDAFTSQAKKLVIGNPLDNSTEIGPLSRGEQLEFLLSQISDAVSKGAKILAGGKEWGKKGFL
jgi:acyl-CoA reductase-like NAD-dependent aldehyde dehydrogenase/gamma-glutamyl-gamma-aminobutyrate hydrolase PuuD